MRPDDVIRRGGTFIDTGARDVLLCTGRAGGMIQYRNAGYVFTRSGSMGIFCYDKIIQRNNLPFYNPELEP
jgi:hypothetical protein